MAAKQKIINIYFGRAGFGSKVTTLKDAREKINQLRWQMLINSLGKLLK